MEDDNNKAQSQQNSARNSSTKITSAKGSSTNSGVVSRHESTQNLSKPAPKQTQETAPVNAVIYENTFKLKPDHKFSSESVQKIVQEIMQNTLKTLVYDAAKATGIATLLSQEILEAVKKLEFDRYKIVVDVTIGEFKGQGIRVASRCVWDTSTDSYASCHFRNSTMFAVAIVFGGYFE